MKRFFTLLIAFFAIATGTQAYTLAVGGYNVSTNWGSRNFDGAEWDAQTLTLTIDNLELSESGSLIYAVDFGSSTLTIVVKGTCKLTSSYENALYIENSNVVVKGEGKLELTSNEKTAILLDRGSELTLLDADVSARGYDCAVEGLNGDNVTVNHSSLYADSQNYGDATIHGLDGFNLIDAEYNDLSLALEDFYNNWCRFYGQYFHYSSEDAAIRYDGTYTDEDYSVDDDLNCIWNYDVFISPTSRSAEAYAVYSASNSSLTFYFDEQMSTRPGTEKYKLGTGDPATYNLNPWYLTDAVSNIKHVVFDPSFADYRPTITTYWFYDLTLEDITGMQYVNTSEVTNMSNMFGNFSFGTYLGSELKELDLSTFDTRNVTKMGSMFSGCTLTTIDLSAFDTHKVESMTSMFSSCPNLKTIYVGDNWSTESLASQGDYWMFSGSTNLKGGEGTTFDSGHVNSAYAHVDGGNANPGYLTYNKVYPLWVLGNRVTDRNSDCIYRTTYMGQLSNDYPVAAEFKPSMNMLRLSYLDTKNPVTVGFLGTKSMVSNGDIDLDIPGIDGLTIIVDHTELGTQGHNYSQSGMATQETCFEINANTTVTGGNFAFFGNQGPAVRIGKTAQFKIIDLLGTMILVAPNTVIQGAGEYFNSELVISNSSVRLHQLNGSVNGVQGATIDGIKKFHIYGIVFEDVPAETENTPGTVGWSDGVQGSEFSVNYIIHQICYLGNRYADAVWMKKDLSNDMVFEICNGDVNNYMFRMLLNLFTDNTGYEAHYVVEPYLVTQEEDGNIYYLQASDNRALFYIEPTRGAFTLVPGANGVEVSMPVSNVLETFFQDLWQYEVSVNEILNEMAWFRGNNIVLHMGKIVPTAIESPEVQGSEASQRKVYNISGQRIEGQPTHKGIYIIDGRKVVVK